MTIPKLRLITTDQESFTADYQTLSHVHIPSGRRVRAGARIVTPAAANSLPSVYRARRAQNRQQIKPFNSCLPLVTTPQQSNTQIIAA